MSAHHINTEHSELGSPSSMNRNRQALPPIRTVLGEQLSLPTFTSSYSPRSASSRGSTRESRDYETHHTAESSMVRSSSAMTNDFAQSNDQRHRTRLRSSTVSSHSLHEPHTPSFSPSACSLPPSPFHLTPSPNPRPFPAPPAPPNSAPPSYYNVLRPSPSGGLITASPVSRTRKSANGKSASRSAPNSIPSSEERRHVCPLCQKRFSRPSSLRTHQSVHTGSRPFACLHPGCPKMFSVASNMRRHLKKHTGGGKVDNADRETRTDGPDLESMASSSEGDNDGDIEMEVEEEEEVMMTRPSFGHSAYFEWSSTSGAT